MTSDGLDRGADTATDPGGRDSSGWIQFAGILAFLTLAALDAFVDDFDPGRELFVILGFVILAFGPDQVIRFILAARGKLEQ